MAEEESTNNVSKQSQLQRRDSQRARKVTYPTQFEVRLARAVLLLLERVEPPADDAEWLEHTQRILLIAEPGLRRDSGSNG